MLHRAHLGTGDRFCLATQQCLESPAARRIGRSIVATAAVRRIVVESSGHDGVDGPAVNPSCEVVVVVVVRVELRLKAR